MRVAMGLALNEIDREARAIEFYEVLSSFDFMSSTPTLFNAGTQHSQLSSCYLTTVADDLDGIYEAIKENALLSKYAGGLGNDWTPVRALGRHIKGTNGKSQGVVPFLKVVNDTAVAVNQGGKRKGAVCAYLETWHLDIEEFLELRKNTGDDRRRTHDMNTANWIPDLFMKRVMEDGEWTLFSPSRRARPARPVRQGLRGSATCATKSKAARRRAQAASSKIPALRLWRKMLTMLFETGHPWITFKDPCNVRSPQQHVGVVHSSNLCTEITLNTSEAEIAVCNLGSVNLVGPHGRRTAGRLRPRPGQARSRRSRTAMRMLDNVIDINYYAVGEGAQLQPAASPGRPRHHGLPGLPAPDAHRRTPREAAVEFADRSMEAICYYAYWASTELAEERGRYRRYRGLAVGPRHPAAATRSTCWPRSAAATSRSTARRPWTGRALRDAHQAARHAQFQLHGDRADGDHLQHHRRRRLHRADLPEPLRQVATSPASSRSSTSYLVARPEDARPVGRGHGRRPQVLRRLAREDRPHPGGRCAQLYATAFEVEPQVAGRVRRAPPEVDRPGAVAQHLHGRRLGQEAATTPTSSPGSAA